MTEIKENDIVAFATRKDPSRIKYIARVNGTSKGYRRDSIHTTLFIKEHYYWYDVEKDEKIHQLISKKSRQLLINDEIPKTLLKKFYDFEERTENFLEKEKIKARDLLHEIYTTETHNVDVYLSDGGYFIIKNGNGQHPVATISLETKERLMRDGHLHGNTLLSFKGRKCYPYKLTSDKKEEDIPLLLY